jgi:hypothetical protein
VKKTCQNSIVKPSLSCLSVKIGRSYTCARRGNSIPLGEVNVVVVNSFPKCQKCDLGDLVPLSDFGSQGAAIYFKAWACTNPTCGFNIKIRNGDLYIDEPISSGAMHTPRVRA